MFYIIDFQINENKTVQYPVIENKVKAVHGVVENYPVSAAHKSKAFTKFQKEGLKVINQAGLSSFSDTI
jgi:hypothetical protein